MSNHCHNSLVIEGTKEQIEVFREALRHEENELSFSHLRNDDCIYDDWGREPRLESIDYNEEGNLIYTFITANVPPRRFLHDMSWKYPELTLNLHFHEIYAGFMGSTEWKNGQVITDEMEDINHLKESDNDENENELTESKEITYVQVEKSTSDKNKTKIIIDIDSFLDSV